MTDELAERDPNAPGVGSLINQFSHTLVGIRQVLRIAEPHLDKEMPPELVDLFERMAGTQVRVLRVFLFNLRAGLAPAPQEGADAKTLLPTPEIPTTESQWVDLEERAQAGHVTEEEWIQLTETFFPSMNDKALLGVFVRKWNEFLGTPAQQLMLNGAMLVTAVAAFETLIAGLVTHQHQEFPSLLESTTPQFSLDDLDAFQDIADARALLIERKVDRFMRESFDHWVKSLRDANLDLLELAIDPGRFREIFFRRNIVVHSQSCVSREYIKQMAPEAAELTVGTELPVSTDYLDTALDELVAAGVGLGITAWTKWHKDESVFAVKEIQRVGYDLLEEGRYAACEKLCRTGMSLTSAGWYYEAMRVNAWIARKQTAGVEEIREDVTQWDVSALAPDFALAKDALLDDLDAVFERIPRMLEQGLINDLFLAKWPLLAGARDDPRYAALTKAREEQAFATDEVAEPHGNISELPGG